MPSSSFRRLQFAALLYDLCPQARKASENAGIGRLVMLVSERLAQTHSVDKF